jgi:hypothetical protein
LSTPPSADRPVFNGEPLPPGFCPFSTAHRCHAPHDPPIFFAHVWRRDPTSVKLPDPPLTDVHLCSNEDQVPPSVRSASPSPYRFTMSWSSSYCRRSRREPWSRVVKTLLTASLLVPPSATPCQCHAREPPRQRAPRTTLGSAMVPR